MKTFVLDTNILLNDPKAITDGFDDNCVVLCGTTLQELDKKKNLGGEIGYHARESARILDALRKEGDLREGIRLKNGGILRVVVDGVNGGLLPEGYSIEDPDNRIISTCLSMQEHGNKSVILVTNDISMRVNANVCGVKVEGYRNDQVSDDAYTGHVDLEVGPEDIAWIYKDGSIPMPKGVELLPNQFATLHGGPHQSALSVFHNQALQLVGRKAVFGGVEPMNSMQQYAIWALTAPAEDVPLVILKGAAGTAKTFLSLAAGLSETYTAQRKRERKYHRMLIARPNVETVDSPGFGFLPGELPDKMGPLLAPYYDNLEALFSESDDEEDRRDTNRKVDDLFADNVIDICPLNYIRGRSLNRVYLICDEAQNATRSLIRDVITRAGKGTKVVLCGDPDQIDAATLDKRNNGLVYAAEKMKGSRLAAIVTFDAQNSVRSELAKEAAKLLKGGK